MQWRAIKWVLILWLAGGAAAWAVQSPQDLVQQTADQMVSKLREERQVIDQHPGRIYDLVNEIVLPHFDFERMSSWVLGKYWRSASPDQRKRFTVEFRNLLVRTYAKSLSSYQDNKISYLPFRGRPGQDDVTVRTEVDQPGGFPIPIDYDLYLKGDEWKVYDVIVENISLVNNYRSQFRRVLERSSFAELLQTIRGKVH